MTKIDSQNLLGPALWLVVLCLVAGGCAASSGGLIPLGPRPNIGAVPWDNPNLVSPERLDQGYTIVLPGIWGDVSLDYGIVVGLKDANVPAAVELYDWTAPGSFMVLNLLGQDRNREEAQRLAQRIVAYQTRYPGRPVHLIGYSGGAAVAVFTLEALPSDHSISRAILLAPTLAYNYNLEAALNRTERGIDSFYSLLDAPILGAAVATLGTSDGRHVFAAGTIGFSGPPGLTGEPLASYQQRVSQRSYQLDMLRDGHLGGHFGWSRSMFVGQYLAPLIAPATDMNTDESPHLARLPSPIY